MTLNDGKGLFDNAGLCETLIVDLNSLIKDIASGQYVHFCIMATTMVQKLQNLQKGIKADMDNRNNTIEQLKNQIKELGGECKKIPVEELLQKDGAE